MIKDIRKHKQMKRDKLEEKFKEDSTRYNAKLNRISLKVKNGADVKEEEWIDMLKELGRSMETINKMNESRKKKGKLTKEEEELSKLEAFKYLP